MYGEWSEAVPSISQLLNRNPPAWLGRFIAAARDALID
jgi:hypothetical protein